MRQNVRGFTLIELLTFFLICCVACFGFVGAGFMSNAWYGENGVAREIVVTRPEVKRVLLTKRSIYAYSRVTVELVDGKQKTYCLDTNILWNYTFLECP